MLAVGLVLLTMVIVAVVAHAIVPGLPWAAAFVLGAIVSPTDPIAATAIMRRLGVPRRVVTILEGESLVNDGTALVAYRFAVAAAVSGTFTLWEAGLSFVLNVAGGVAIGLGVGWIVRQVRRRLDYPPAEITISLLTGYFAYLPAELLGVSAVIAAVTAGHLPRLAHAGADERRGAPARRVDVADRHLRPERAPLHPDRAAAAGDPRRARSPTRRRPALVGARGLADRRARPLRSGSIPAAWLPRRLSRRIREREPMPRAPSSRSSRGRACAARVSLAAALAIPLSTDAGEPFPGRNLILFLTFAVILGTLVVQGLTLPAVIRLLRLEDDAADEAARGGAGPDRRGGRPRSHGWTSSSDEDWVRADTADRIRGSYGFRRDRFSARLRRRRRRRDRGALASTTSGCGASCSTPSATAVLELRRAGAISDEVVRRVSRDLDLEDARLEI